MDYSELIEALTKDVLGDVEVLDEDHVLIGNDVFEIIDDINEDIPIGLVGVRKANEKAEAEKRREQAKNAIGLSALNKLKPETKKEVTKKPIDAKKEPADAKKDFEVQKAQRLATLKSKVAKIHDIKKYAKKEADGAKEGKQAEERVGKQAEERVGEKTNREEAAKRQEQAKERREEKPKTGTKEDIKKPVENKKSAMDRARAVINHTKDGIEIGRDKYKLDSLDGSKDSNGHVDGKPVDRQEFARRLRAQNRAIDARKDRELSAKEAREARGANVAL